MNWNVYTMCNVYWYILIKWWNKYNIDNDCNDSNCNCIDYDNCNNDYIILYV